MKIGETPTPTMLLFYTKPVGEAKCPTTKFPIQGLMKLRMIPLYFLILFYKTLRHFRAQAAFFLLRVLSITQRQQRETDEETETEDKRSCRKCQVGRFSRIQRVMSVWIIC